MERIRPMHFRLRFILRLQDSVIRSLILLRLAPIFPFILVIIILINHPVIFLISGSTPILPSMMTRWRILTMRWLGSIPLNLQSTPMINLSLIMFRIRSDLIRIKKKPLKWAIQFDSLHLSTRSTIHMSSSIHTIRRSHMSRNIYNCIIWNFTKFKVIRPLQGNSVHVIDYNISLFAPTNYQLTHNVYKNSHWNLWMFIEIYLFHPHRSALIVWHLIDAF